MNLTTNPALSHVYKSTEALRGRGMMSSADGGCPSYANTACLGLEHNIIIMLNLDRAVNTD